MEPIPDYSQYTLDELYDVACHINRDAYPERYRVIKERIELLEGQPRPTGFALPTAKNQLAYRIIAGYQILSGALLTINFLAAIVLPASLSAPVPTSYYLVVVALTLIYGVGDLAAGVTLWRGQPNGVPLSYIVQAIQIPTFGYQFFGNQTGVSAGINFIPAIVIAVLAATQKRALNAPAPVNNSETQGDANDLNSPPIPDP